MTKKQARKLIRKALNLSNRLHCIGDDRDEKHTLLNDLGDSVRTIIRGFPTLDYKAAKAQLRDYKTQVKALTKDLVPA